MPTKCCWVIHGSLTSERKASTSPSSFINHSTLLLNRALKRQAPILFTCTSKFERSTGSERVDALGLRAVEVIICMITRDFSVISMTSQASLSLSLPLTKVTDAQYRKRFRASYNKSSVRPLGFVPAKSEPKSRANPVPRLCLPWLWLTMISSRKDAGSRALFFVSSPTASGVQLPFETNSIWIFLTSVLSFFTPGASQDFHTQEIDDWRPKFRFQLWWPLIDWLLSAVFGEGARKHWENNQGEESNPQGQNGRARENPGRHRHFVFSRPGLAFTASPCIAWQVARDRWHLLERARLRFHRRKRSVPSKARPTMLAFTSNTKNYWK